MHIVSNFKDYYDSASWGPADPKRVYVRKTEEIREFPDKIWKKLRDERPEIPGKNIISEDQLSTGFVLFCGQIFPYWIVGIKQHYSIKALVKALSTYKKDEFDTYEEATSRKRLAKKLGTQTLKNQWWSDNPVLTEENLATYTENQRDRVRDYMISHNTPVIHMYRSGCDLEIEKNPRLYLLNFQSIMDPATAFQEIEMFISNDLVLQRDPEVRVSDEIRAGSHGFDKFSFRREKKKKKRPRR